MKNRMGIIFTLLLILVSCSACGTELNTDVTGNTNMPTPEMSFPLPESVTSTGNENAESNQAADNLFDETAIQEEWRIVAQACEDIYKDMERITQFDEVIFIPTDDEKEQIMSCIGGLGLPVYVSGHDMPNHELVKEFYEAVQNGLESSIGVYTFYDKLTRVSFYTKDGIVYNTRVTMEWDEDFQPVFSSISYVSSLELFEMTDKGWLFYGQQKNPEGHFHYKEGFRVSPLGEEKRTLCEKYLAPLKDYTGHNILLSNWDITCISSVSFNDVFEMLYEYENGYSPSEVYTECYSPDNYMVIAVPAADFEKVITKYFPVTAEQLREYAVYDREKRVYAWEPLITGGPSPEWEVVDYTYNNDGSLTITVDAVSDVYGRDKTGVNIVTVMPHTDGTFHYLSNRLEYSDESTGIRPSFPSYYPRVKK